MERSSMSTANQTVCVNPGADEIIAYTPHHTRIEVTAIARRARAAQALWARSTPIQRAKVVRALSGHLVRASEDLARQIAAENGKTEAEALATEILPAVQAVATFARRAPAMLRDRHLRPSRQHPQGGRIRKEMPISISNVLPVDPKTNQPTRVGFRTDAKGAKERFARKSGESLGTVRKAK